MKKQYLIYIGILIVGALVGYFISQSTNQNIKESPRQHINKLENQEWTCSMHPQIRQNEPGKCPICGMELIPVQTHMDNADPMAIKMSPTAMQLASVQTEIVKKSKPIKELRLQGKVQADESKVSSQTTHIAGRIEKLLINTTNEYVKQGQVIAFIYSPELVTAQEELFEAYKIRKDYPQLYQASRNKLKNWKLTDKQINAILKSGKTVENFPILAEMDGIVLRKKVNLGDYVQQGTSLFEIADLSHVWILFDVYEADLSWVHVGDEITYTVQAEPNLPFQGKVSFIDPIIDPKTRVAKARVTANNASGVLKPEMFTTGLLKSPLNSQEEAIIIPKSAVMWTGEQSVVYVKTTSENEVNFTMRKITTGASLGKSIIVANGLSEGEEIATHGTFSIDAAAQLAGKPSMMNPEISESMTSHTHSNSSGTNSHSATIAVSQEVKQALLPLFESYFKLKNALVNDDFNSAINAAKQYQNALSKVNMTLFKGEAHTPWMEQSAEAKLAISSILGSQDIAAVRKHFVQLSGQMVLMAKTFEPSTKTLFVQHCPMANEDNGADWLSTENEIKNPYFGASMLQCGEVTDSIK